METTQATLEESSPVRTPSEGDVYRFVYNQEAWDRARAGLGHGDLRWCFDGQLVWRDGRLHDTYWGFRMHDGRKLSWGEAERDGTLTFVCNLNEVEKIREEEFELYADGDAFDLTHQHGCYKYFVKRVGAPKDKGRMTAAVNRLVTEAHSQIEKAVRNLEWAVRRREQLLPKIEAGQEPSI
jgi:hypothetical protein